MWLLSGAQGKGREREREREREKEKKKKKKKEKEKEEEKKKGRERERKKTHTSKKTQRRKHTAAERSKALESMRPPPTASPKIIPTFRYTYHNRCDKTTCITSTTLVLRKTTKPNMAILGVRDCENSLAVCCQRFRPFHSWSTETWPKVTDLAIQLQLIEFLKMR